MPAPLVNVLLAGKLGLGVAAGEIYRAAVSRRRVVVLVFGRHRDAERRARRGSCRGALTTKWLAAAALTATASLLPVMLLVTVSVAVTV